MSEDIVAFIRSLYPGRETIALHEPLLNEADAQAVADTVRSGFVSAVGKQVADFEQAFAKYVGAAHAVATITGTAALQVCLRLAGVGPGDEVLTQGLSFVATANAIVYQGAAPVFLDVEADTLGLSPAALSRFLNEATEKRDGLVHNKQTGRAIKAVVPVHVLGHAARVQDIVAICQDYGLPVIEDAAEALGSSINLRQPVGTAHKHTGTLGLMGVFSFNGNKILTTGNGGMIVTDDPDLAARAKHLTTTAKQPHPWAYEHDTIGYNYRLPNLNAALGLSQLARLNDFLSDKKAVADAYAAFFADRSEDYFSAPAHSRSNYWLNALRLADQTARDALLSELHDANILARPLWNVLADLVPYRHCQTDKLAVAREAEARMICLPSGARELIHA